MALCHFGFLCFRLHLQAARGVSNYSLPVQAMIKLALVPSLFLIACLITGSVARCAINFPQAP
jgi:hypothetical protein